MPDFLPAKNAELLAWSSSFSEKINLTPTAFGLVASQSAGYQTLHEAFENALSISSDPATRTRGTVQATRDARTPLKAEARELARIINAFPSITNQQRIDLGLTPRTNEPSPINPPEEPPVLEVVSANGRIVKVRLRGQNSEGRGKPEGVDGATVFAFIGAAPPADITQWIFMGSTTRTIFDVEFPSSAPAGAQVWLTAFWKNPRDMSGPACAPVAAYLAGGVGVSQQAA
jgi:hypothetical protein